MSGEAVLCDRCGRKLIKANPKAELSERQRRFLGVYSQRLAIAPAARLAGVHRATVYRWLEGPAFAQAFRVAAEEFFRQTQARVLAEEEARRRWREERELARRPLRCYHLARAREAKR